MMHFHEANRINSIMKADRHPFFYASYEKTHDKLCSFGFPCPVLTFDRNGRPTLSLDHALCLDDDTTRESHFRVSVNAVFPENDDDPDLFDILETQIIKEFPGKDVFTAKVPSLHDIARAQDQEALSKIYENDEKMTDARIFSSAIVPTDLAIKFVENKCTDAWHYLTIAHSFFRSHNIIVNKKKEPRKQKFYTPERIFNLLSFLHNASFELDSEDGDRGVRRLLHQTGVETLPPSEYTSIEVQNMMNIKAMTVDRLSHEEEPSNEENENNRADNQREENVTDVDDVPEVQDTSEGLDGTDVDLPPIPRRTRDASLPQSGSPERMINGEQQQDTYRRVCADTLSRLQERYGENQIPITDLTNISVMMGLQTFNEGLSKFSDAMIANSQATTKKNDKGFPSWHENIQKGFLVILSPDPSSPITSVPKDIETLCAMKATKAALHLRDENFIHRWVPDPAMVHAWVNGDFYMNEAIRPDQPVKGVTVFSTPIAGFIKPNGKKVCLNMLDAMLENPNCNINESHVQTYTCQTLNCPTNYCETMGFLDCYVIACNRMRHELSWLTVHTTWFVNELHLMKIQFTRLERQYGVAFIFSLLARLHIYTAIFVNRCLHYPNQVTKEDFNLRPLILAMKDSTFWNRFQYEGHEYYTRLQQQGGGGNPQPAAPNGQPRKRANDNDDNGNNQNGARLKLINPNGKISGGELNMADLSKAFGKMKVDANENLVCPKINNVDVCMKWFFAGRCHSNCERKASHIKVPGQKLNELKAFRKKLEDYSKNRANNQDTPIDRMTIFSKGFNQQRKRTVVKTRRSKDPPDIGKSPTDQTTTTQARRTTSVKSSTTKIADQRKPEIRQESTFIRMVRRLVSKTYPANKNPIFKFQNTPEAATFNSKILEDFHYDISQAIDAQGHTIMTPGTEYRPVEDLEEIFQHHVDWPLFKGIATEGVRYHFDKNIEYTEEMRMSDLKAAIKKGNNISTKEEGMEKIIDKNYDKEVSKGWMIPILKSIVLKMKGIRIIPIGIAKQWTLNEEGKRVRKNRTTHDLSRPWISGHSVNNMIDKSQLLPCHFAFMLTRYLHQMHHMRFHHPTTPILQGKIDLDAAFRRLHVWIWHAIMATTIVKGLAYILLRLSFGGNEGPGQHDVPSNMVVDLAQEILDDETWDPHTLHSPHADKIPEPEELDDDIPYGTAHPLAVKLEKPRKAYVDGYVDDLATLLLKLQNIPERGRQAVALAIHAFFRPVNSDDPVPRDDVLSIRKLYAEGKLEEVKVILGWLIDSRRFLIKLTEDKSQAWMEDLDTVVQLTRDRENVSENTLESLYGKLNTAAFLHREMRYFLTCLNWCIRQAKKKGGRTILPLKLIPDLLLWRLSLQRFTTVGRSINHITITLPYGFTKQDASTAAIAGFNCLGLAWRFIIPVQLRRLIHINILEFMAVVVTIWVTIKSMNITDGNGAKILAQTDNTSALGWLKSASKFNKSDGVNSRLREIIGRKLTLILMEADLSLYSQHVKGEHNHVADYLSRNIRLTNSQHLQNIKQKYGDIIPDNFRIVGLPNEISSWILSIWGEAIRMQDLPKDQKKKLRAVLENGESSQPHAGLTFTSEVKRNSGKFKSLVASRDASAIISLARKMGMNLEDEQFAPKSSLYQRLSGRLDMKTLSEMEAP